jgi:hypothetical protein
LCTEDDDRYHDGVGDGEKRREQTLPAADASRRGREGARLGTDPFVQRAARVGVRALVDRHASEPLVRAVVADCHVPIISLKKLNAARTRG